MSRVNVKASSQHGEAARWGSSRISRLSSVESRSENTRRSRAIGATSGQDGHGKVHRCSGVLLYSISGSSGVAADGI